MRETVVVGGGDHGKVIISLLNKAEASIVAGYTDLNDRGDVMGAPYMGTDEVLKSLITKLRLDAVVGIGMTQQSNAAKREEMHHWLMSLGFDLPAIRSPNAVVNEDVRLGDGTVVMDGTIVGLGSRTGQGVILNTRCTIDHDCWIGDFSHIGPAAVLARGCQIGRRVLVGAGSVICPQIKITDDSTIAPGAVVEKDCTKPGLYAGVPAKKMDA